MIFIHIVLLNTIVKKIFSFNLKSFKLDVNVVNELEKVYSENNRTTLMSGSKWFLIAYKMILEALNITIEIACSKFDRIYLFCAIIIIVFG